MQNAITTNVPINQWSTYFHITMYDSSEQQLKKLIDLATNDKVKYIVISEPHTGNVLKKEHYHVGIQFKRNYTPPFVRKMVIHNNDYEDVPYIEGKYKTSTVDEWRSYIIKSGIKFESKPYLPQGKPKTEEQALNKERKKDLMNLRVQKAKAQDWEWFENEDIDFMLSHRFKNLIALYKRTNMNNLRALPGKLENYWIYGSSGTGKSASIEKIYGYDKLYPKNLTEVYWNGYDNDYHDSVWIDELDTSDALKTIGGVEILKQLADRYPFKVRMMYGNGESLVRPKRTIITSNFMPDTVLPEKGFNVNIKAIRRKFKVIHIDDWLKLHSLECIPNKGVFNKDEMDLIYERENINMFLEDRVNVNE